MIFDNLFESLMKPNFIANIYSQLTIFLKISSVYLKPTGRLISKWVKLFGSDRYQDW